jgi:hypothetical protein
LALTSLQIGSVGSLVVHITSTYLFPRRSPDHALRGTGMIRLAYVLRILTHADTTTPEEEG